MTAGGVRHTVGKPNYALCEGCSFCRYVVAGTAAPVGPVTVRSSAATASGRLPSTYTTWSRLLWVTGSLRDGLKPKRLLAALLAVVTGALPVVAGHGRWRFAAAFVMAIVYGSVPLWPRPSTVQKHLFRPPKSGVVLPSSPVADGLKAVAYLLGAVAGLAVAGIVFGLPGWSALRLSAVGLLLVSVSVSVAADAASLPPVPPGEL